LITVLPPLHFSQTITSEMRSDPDVVAVRNGGMPQRLGRAKSGLAATPSLG
jgi:hypothetical protein